MRFIRFDRIPQCDGQDTDFPQQYRALHAWHILTRDKIPGLLQINNIHFNPGRTKRNGFQAVTNEIFPFTLFYR